MILHRDNERFIRLLADAAEYFGIEDIDVEKDYYVTLFLRKLFVRQPQAILKGGTSLSKGYRIISRFSEDIDLNVSTEGSNVPRKQRSRLFHDIVEIIDELGFVLTNPERIYGHMDFNRYIIYYQYSPEDY